MKPILNALLDSGHTHNDPQPAAEALLARYGIEGPEGVILVATGKIERPSDACLCCGSHNMTRQFFGALPADDRIVVADLEAGLNDLIWIHPGTDDVVLVVSDGSAKSIEIARGACRLATEMGIGRVIGVANRIIAPGEVQRLAGELGITEMAAVPEDAAVVEADRLGVAAFEATPGSPAVLAIGQLAHRLLTAGVRASLPAQDRRD